MLSLLYRHTHSTYAEDHLRGPSPGSFRRAENAFTSATDSRSVIYADRIIGEHENPGLIRVHLRKTNQQAS
jgi:hypothetical protein